MSKNGFFRTLFNGFLIQLVSGLLTYCMLLFLLLGFFGITLLNFKLSPLIFLLYIFIGLPLSFFVTGWVARKVVR
mgnify:CR=1 FL=1